MFIMNVYMCENYVGRSYIIVIAVTKSVSMSIVKAKMIELNPTQ